VTRFPSCIAFGVVALLALLAGFPAEAGKKSKFGKSVEQSLPDPANGEPMTLVVSLSQQKIDVYEGTELLSSAPVSSGMRGYATKTGVFSILEKRRHHHSNIYSGAPMPWMQRLTWSGIALHGGVVPGYPASHGCVRLTFSFAPKLFSVTTVGEHVVVARDRPEPTLVEHSNLFQPLPPPAPPTVAKELIKQRESSLGESPNSVAAASTLILAKRGAVAVDPDPHQPKPVAEDQGHAATEPSASSQVHAIGSVTGKGTQPDAISTSTQSSDNADGLLAVDDRALEVGPVLAAAPAVAMPEPSPLREADGPTPPSTMANAVEAGAKASGVEAAEPSSKAPLRILITRRTDRDRLVGLQRVLSSLGYLEPMRFDGTFGRATITAIKAFQRANDMPETGAFNSDLVKKAYQVAGKDEPPSGHLFVRQEFDRVFDAAVSFRDPDQPLGTYLYTVLKFESDDTKARWTEITVQPSELNPLDRLEIPDEIRQRISERLTPGSSLIVADIAINTAALTKGADFLVWAKEKPAEVSQAKAEAPAAVTRLRVKRKSRNMARRHNQRQPPWLTRPW